ncbi:MAG: dNTP triphosphohydrolase [Acidobacteriota bacterium]|nr:dNTP triphosphohydrolase [Acidobacteriota bacterium]
MDDFLLERHHPEPPGSPKDHRHATERDRDRILHSSAFRRLQGKTQVFGTGQADFYRTRLTHSIETSQIARAIAHNLCAENPELERCVTPELAEAVALAHDLGHPPFGHTGERTLDECMKEVSRGARRDGEECLRFEGNAQTFHILVAAEPKSPAYPGLNLTRATLAGVMKYPFEQDVHADKFIFASDVPIARWTLRRGGRLAKARPSGDAAGGGKPRPAAQPKTSIVCQIMNWADDCAYSIHDVEDALQAQFLHPGDFDQARFVRRVFAHYEETRVSEAVPKLGVEETRDRLMDLKRRIMPSDAGGDERAQRKAALRDILNNLITSVALKPRRGGGRADFSWRLDIDPESRILAVLCKAVIWEAVITDPRVAAVNTKGREILRDLFHLFMEEALEKRSTALFPRYYRPAVEESLDGGRDAVARAVCNFLALMTDMDALRLHDLLRGSKTSSIFDFI